jgi:hypothetical protein
MTTHDVVAGCYASLHIWTLAYMPHSRSRKQSCPSRASRCTPRSICWEEGLDDDGISEDLWASRWIIPGVTEISQGICGRQKTYIERGGSMQHASRGEPEIQAPFDRTPLPLQLLLLRRMPTKRFSRRSHFSVKKVGAALFWRVQRSPTKQGPRATVCPYE